MPSPLKNLWSFFCACFERKADPSELASTVTHQTVVQLTPEGHEDMLSQLSDVGNAFQKSFERTGDLVEIQCAISTHQMAIQLTPEGDAAMPSRLNDLGGSFRKRFERTSDLADIDSAISNKKRAVQLTPEGDADMSTWLCNLGNSLWMRFERTGHLADIESAIATYQKAVQLIPEGDANKPSLLNNLGVSFQARFERTGDLADIASAISNKQRAVELTPEGDADMPNWLGNLGISLQARFECTNDVADIESAIAAHQRAIRLTPGGHAQMPFWFNNLGNSFNSKMRLEHTENIADIVSAISAHQKAIQLTPEGHMARMCARLNDLGNSFDIRFERTGDLADNANAISTYQRAIQLNPEGHAQMPTVLSNLGSSFKSRFEHTGDLADIESAISTHQRAINLTTEGHAKMPARLISLGNAFQRRFERTGDLSDIISAISAHQKAVGLTQERHADMSSWLSSLGTSFWMRFERAGDLVDISSAITTLQRAVQLTPEGYASMPARLSNLGVAFETRFEHSGDMADIANAISTYQRAFQLTPEGDAHIPSRLSNLGNSFWTCFKHTGDLATITGAISTHEWAVQLTPEGDARMPSRLGNLGVSFQRRFESTGDIEDIANAISRLQSAIELTPEGHTRMPSWLSSLGLSFQTRFRRTGDLSDIVSAISNKQRAIQLTPEGHADTPSRLNGLGNCFEARFTSTHNVEDMYQAISTFRRSATHITGHPSIRLRAARKWAKLSRQHLKSQSLDAFSVAIELLPQVAGLEQTIPKRHQTLVDVSDITCSATAAAIDNSELEMALAWLEQGRCLVWTQINHLRTPADDLRAHDPSLADRFLRVARALEVSGSRQERDAIFSEGNMTQMISLQEEAHTHVHLAKEWNEILLEIRSIRIPEFQDFLRPPQASKLLSRLPPDGTIVIFNIDQDRCDALALISGLDCPVHIPLKTFSIQNAMKLRDDMRQYLKTHRVRQQQDSDRGGFRLGPDSAVDMHKLLREIWEHIVNPILDGLGYSPHQSNHPRIWWCPTGPLAFLPIHAAGIYGKEGEPAGPCTSDYVVSSYTPTVSALLDKIKEAPTTELKPTSLLIISQPSTPGQNPIPGAKREALALRDTIGPPPKSLLLEDGSATVIRVKEEMKTHSSVHFACHAIQDVAEPLNSGVRLHDGRLEVFEMMKQTLPDADLAFLSACQTSTGDEELSDEVVHLAAGMLAAGYRSVVATMWSIKDEYGPVMAKDFYSHILGHVNSEDRRLDGANASRALHYATQTIRKELGDTAEALLIWVPYVHFGV